ncbi:MAG TPA: DUF4173 domain-containing protein [Rhizobiaceae bacterium]|nr:DUF4173 domain-containing protein [Rhizobiaceae bacterium]
MNQFHLQNRFSAKAVVALLLIVAADFLFFDQPVGITLFLFAALLATAVGLLHSAKLAHAAIATLAIVPLFENVSALSVSVALIGLTIFALSVSGHLRGGAARMSRQVAGFLLIAPFRLPFDVARAKNGAERLGRTASRFGSFAVWTMPLVLGAVFLILFGIANPVIDRWLAQIDIWFVFDLLDPVRFAFWILVAIFVWPFLRPRLPRWRRRPRAVAQAVEAPKPEADAAAARTGTIFGKGAILRSLILFNALFAVQTILDAAYLWGGVALPNGMTYAAYAHRGAYPLIATALLAAAFVLIAMRPGSETSGDALIRRLVYLWTAQNVVLVISSILRLDLYVSIYSLTHWRVAAFIWMGLVTVGLLLIIARIWQGKSNEWLLSANLLTLSAVLYACCFINFATMIATYNVTHSREMGGGGRGLDVDYLLSLGPASLPAIETLLRNPLAVHSPAGGRVAMEFATLTTIFFYNQEEWRAWTFRQWRLGRYLDKLIINNPSDAPEPAM